MLKIPVRKIALFLFGIIVVGGSIYQIPQVYSRLEWRIDAAFTYLRGIIYPADEPPSPSLPPASPPTMESPAHLPTLTPASVLPITPTHLPLPDLLPITVSLPSPVWEKQDWNNCGPATLALYLRMYGWQGDQYAISELLEPEQEDRNVNVEELIYFARTQAGWLNAEYRIGGDLKTLKQFLSAGIPVMVEEGFEIDTTYWPNDDLWAGHYLLLTGYDENTQTFIGQDTYYGSDRQIPYQKLDTKLRPLRHTIVRAASGSPNVCYAINLVPLWRIFTPFEQKI